AREAGIVLGIALLASILVRLVLLEPLYVSGPAMSPTLGAGDRVLVAKGLSSVTGLSRGDVVAFADPDNWQDIPAPSTSVFSTALAVLGIAPSPGDDVVMRVIGVGGDRVECCDAQGRILVNGQAVDEDYLPAGMPTDQVTFDVVVPADSYFVLGDDRALARDSRYHLEVNDGAVPDANVIGRVILRAWPPQVLTTPEVFASVPDPQGAP
ncbi:MAG: signal peptidase I, partial [Actinomycetales bacterium mxb001]